MSLSYKERIATVACIYWLVIAFVFITDTRWLVNGDWEDFVAKGLLPVVTILGIMWIWRGKEDSDQDKDNTNPS